MKAAVRWVRWYGTVGAGTYPPYPPVQFVPYPPIPTHAHPYPPVPHLFYPPYPTKMQVSDVPTHVETPIFLFIPTESKIKYTYNLSPHHCLNTMCLSTHDLSRHNLSTDHNMSTHTMPTQNLSTHTFSLHNLSTHVGRHGNWWQLSPLPVDWVEHLVTSSDKSGFFELGLADICFDRHGLLGDITPMWCGRHDTWWLLWCGTCGIKELLWGPEAAASLYLNQRTTSTHTKMQATTFQNK